MNRELPKSDAPAGEAPETLWGKLLASTPVVMTVVATLLAGLSSSEMTRAQYDRSLAAQQQARVGDQWGFFQAKRLRSATVKSSLDLLQATADVSPLDPEALRRWAAGVGMTNIDGVLGELVGGPALVSEPVPPTDARLREAMTSVASGRADSEVAKILGGVDPAMLASAVRGAQEQAREFDRQVTPGVRALEQFEQQMSAELPGAREAMKPLWRSVLAVRLRREAARYDAEARFNRAVAELLELQVRQSNRSADHRNARSQMFFAGMLGAQLAVVLASVGLAMRRRNVLWTFAAVIGTAALAFGIYVFIWM